MAKVNLTWKEESSWIHDRVITAYIGGREVGGIFLEEEAWDAVMYSNPRTRFGRWEKTETAKQKLQDGFDEWGTALID